MLDLTKLATETRNPETTDLDKMSPLAIATAMNREDARAVASIEPELSKIAQAIDWGTGALEDGGRIIYMGAGTSGRLGVLDAAECPPTFGVSPDRVVGLIAGGEGAFIKAVEGAEDSAELGASLSLHDALPISRSRSRVEGPGRGACRERPHAVCDRRLALCTRAGLQDGRDRMQHGFQDRGGG